MQKIIAPHDPQWRQTFEAEATQVRRLLSPAALRIHHIGSTAIPAIYAKPVIDILIEASDLAGVDACAPRMTSAHYDVRGEYGIAGRRYFSKPASGAATTGFHVHVYEQGSPQIFRHLAFRDYLLERPDVAAAYSHLKQSIADASGALPADYVARKERFVAETQAAALDHFSVKRP